MDILNVREEFPIKRNRVYLNNASIGPLSNPVISAVDAFMADVRDNGRNHYPQWCEQADHAIKNRIAGMIGANKSEIAFIKNTTEGILIVANGIDWQPGDNVVISSLEFPSNRIVWESLDKCGVDTRIAEIAGVDAAEDAIIKQIDKRTRLVSVSSVQYGTGLRLDIARLGAACRERDVLFCVDAIQSLGAVSFDVQSIQADFVMADGHKWMMGPEGVALFWCRSGIMDRLELKQYGWHMVEDCGTDRVEMPEKRLKIDACGRTIDRAKAPFERRGPVVQGNMPVLRGRFFNRAP